MASPEAYDLVVLGSGEAGKYIARALAAQGKRVAVVERKYVGGSCPNIACLPSKNVIHSAKVAIRQNRITRRPSRGSPAGRPRSPRRAFPERSGISPVTAILA